MNKIAMLTLLVKILQDEEVINADFDFAKREAIKELQNLKLDIVRLSGPRSVMDVSDVVLSIIGMIQAQKLNPRSLQAILAYLKHDPEMLDSLEMPRKAQPAEEVIAKWKSEPLKKAKRIPGSKKASPLE